MTISGWVQPANTSAPGNDGYFGIRSPSSLDDSFYVLQLAGTNDLEMRFINSMVGEEAYAVNVTSAVSGGTWVHVALTYDGDTLIGYVDGQFAGQDTSATGSFNLTDLSFEIGSDGKDKSVELACTPLLISNQLFETIFNNLHCSILTSATLRVGGNFEFLKTRSGMSLFKEKKVVTESVGSPFIYKDQMRFITYHMLVRLSLILLLFNMNLNPLLDQVKQLSSTLQRVSLQQLKK